MTSILLIAAAIYFAWHSYPRNSGPTRMQEFFTDDDGKTWFADDGTKIAPFDHNGRPAVMVKIYQTRDGKLFAGYLTKFTDEMKKIVEKAQATHEFHGGPEAEKGGAQPSGLLVKKPAGTEWIPVENPRAAEIMRVKSPDGSTDFTPVLP